MMKMLPSLRQNADAQDAAALLRSISRPENSTAGQHRVLIMVRSITATAWG